MESKVVIHLHIPKCAGTSLVPLLQDNYGKRLTRTKPGGGWTRLATCNLKRVRCLTGHFPYGVHRYFSKECQYITLLREPVERLASLYWFIRQQMPTHKFRRLAEQKSFGQFVSSQAFADLDNGMVRWLSGERNVGITKPGAPVTEQDLETAKRNLETFLAVGFVSHFDRSVWLFATLLRWEHTHIKERKQVNPDRPSLTPEEMRVAEAACAYDIELYSWAVAQFGGPLGVCV